MLRVANSVIWMHYKPLNSLNGTILAMDSTQIIEISYKSTFNDMRTLFRHLTIVSHVYMIYVCVIAMVLWMGNQGVDIK